MKLEEVIKSGKRFKNPSMAKDEWLTGEECDCFFMIENDDYKISRVFILDPLDVTRDDWETKD